MKLHAYFLASATIFGAIVLAGQPGGAQQQTAVAGAPAAATPGTPPVPGMLRGFGTTYVDTCAGCHGNDLSGGRGPSLFNEKLLAARTDDALHATIANGIPGTEMPAFKDILSDPDIWKLIAYLRTRGAIEKGPAPFVPNANNHVIHSQKQAFRIETVAAGLDTPWGLAFLPDGRLLVTERAGRLRIVDKNGKLLPEAVTGTPKVWARQDSGMLDVAVPPDYKKSGWVYLAYTDVAPGHVITDAELNPPAGARPVSPPTMTVLIRGKIDAHNQWGQTQEIFRAPADLYTISGAHYGTRFLFDRHGHVFFSLGERGDMRNAQNLGSPLGKIHRVNADGSIPKDNPFVHTPGAIPSIWSYGHRNPQGLAWDPVTGLLWESEHGPTGGDEINIIEKGHNYGWGVASMGMQPGITQRSAPGMDQPIVYWTPTIAPSGISFYRGNRYPGWKNSLFVAALAGQQLRRLEIKGRNVVSQEIIFQQFGRTRATATGPDGLLYVLLQNPTGQGTGLPLSQATPGNLIRLVPLSK